MDLEIVYKKWESSLFGLLLPQLVSLWTADPTAAAEAAAAIQQQQQQQNFHNKSQGTCEPKKVSEILYFGYTSPIQMEDIHTLWTVCHLSANLWWATSKIWVKILPQFMRRKCLLAQSFVFLSCLNKIMTQILCQLRICYDKNKCEWIVSW